MQVVINKAPFAEQCMYRMNPGKVELEQMIQNRCIGGHFCPGGVRGSNAAHFVIRGFVGRMVRLPGRKSFEVHHWRAAQPFDDAIVCLAVPEALEDVWYLFISRQSLEDLFSYMVLGPKLLDLLDQFLLRMLDMNLVNAIGGLEPCRAPLARLVAVTLQSVSVEDWRAP